MRRLARLLPYLAILAVLIVALAALLRAGPLAEHVRNLATAELSNQLDRDVSIGSAALTLSGRVTLRDVHVRDTDGGTLLKAPEVEVRVGNPKSRFPLLSTPTEIRAIRLRAPEVNLTRRASGELNISDLLARPKKKPTFTGSVSVENGRLTFVDETAGGLATTIEGVDLSLRYPTAGRAVFRVTASANEGAFTALKITGESDASDGRTELKGSVEGLDVAFALARVPNFRVLSASAGTADVTGTLRTGGEAGPHYEVTAEVADAEVAFPWLRRPVKEAAGELRFADGDLQLKDVRGTVADAPVEVAGRITDLKAPELDLAVKVTGIRYPQARALFPRVTLPAALILPSPLRVEARVTGPAGDPRVTGKANVKVIKFNAIPWHDLAGEFEYQGGRLKLSRVRAHGSPRQFEADVDLDLRQGRSAAEGSVTLTNIPLSVLAQMAGIAGTFEGTVQARVQGRVDGGKAVAGTVEVEGAVIRGVNLGRLSGSFEYSDGTMRLHDLKVAGDTATGVVQAAFTLDGDYQLSAQLQALDLSAIGPAVTLKGLRGQCCAQVEARGRISEGEASGQITLGPGELQGRAFERLTVGFAVSPERVLLSNLTFKAGEGDYRGDFAVTGWREDPRRAEIAGRVELGGVDLAAWVPTRFAALPGGRAAGSIELSGTLGDPAVVVDVHVSSPSLAGQQLEAGRFEARYGKRRLAIEEMYLDTEGGRIVVTGGYGLDTGWDIEVTGEDLVLGRLSGELRSRFGLAISGSATLHATVTGPASRPEAIFAVSAGPLSVNEVAFDELAIAGGYRDGAVRLETGTLRRGDREVSLSGQIGPKAAVDVTLALTAVDLKTALMIGDRAVWRLYRAGMRSKYFSTYAKIPRPLEGTLTGPNALRLTGTLDHLQAHTSLTVKGLGFNGRRIEKIEADATAWLSAEVPNRYALDKAEVNLEATHDVARATLTGEIIPPDASYLVLDVGNLDLRLLAPWLGTGVELGGMATVNFDISGDLTRPVLRGDIFADNLRVGGVKLETVAASPIQIRNGVLSVDEIRLRDGPTEGRGSAELPIYGIAALPKAEFHLTEASVSLLPGMQPAVFDVDVYLVGNRLILRDGAGPGSTLAVPGIRGSLGTGAFTVGGQIVLRDLRPAQWSRNTFDITAEFHKAQLVVGSFVDTKVTGMMLLTTDPATGSARLTTPDGRPLVVSDATLGLPGEDFAGPSGELPFAPEVAARLLVGENVLFRYGSKQRPTEIRLTPGVIPEEGTPTGYLDVGGKLSAEGLTLDGEVSSSEGRLSFPNGVLALRRATAWVDRKAGEPPVVTVAAEADGRVGEYYITLNPVGQIYPVETEQGTAGPPLALNVSSAPYLEEGFVLALLVGPVVAPTRGARPDVSTLLADPTRGPSSGGQITGVRLPAFGDSLGMQELSLDVGLTGSVQLRLAQRLSQRVTLTYVSVLTQQPESYTLRASYRFTPLVSVGWAVNELDQGRWELQSFIPF